MKNMSQLKYNFGIKMRAYPSAQQKRIIQINCDAARFVYNKQVEINKELWLLNKSKIYIKQNAERINVLKQRLHSYPEMKNHYLFLADNRIDSLAISNTRRAYQSAWSQFKKVKSAKPPSYHQKGYQMKYRTSCQYSNGNVSPYQGTVKFTADMKHLKLPKLGVIRVSGSQARVLKDKSDIRIGTATVQIDSCGNYYISLNMGSDTPFVKNKYKTGKKLGVDLNIDNFLATSNYAMVPNPRFYRRSVKRLAKQQRKLSRRQRRAINEHRPLKTAINVQKQRKVVAKIARKVRNQRSNFINLLVNDLWNKYDVVVAENLLSKNMLRNHSLAMSISDAGWREFLLKMQQKAQMYNKTFIMVDPRNTTQTCSNCGHIMGHDNTKKLTLKIREWDCPKCGYHHIRDCNAAINILNRGLTQLQKVQEEQVSA